MPVRRINFCIADVALVVEQGLDDFAAARGREAPVGAEADQQEFGGGFGERLRQVAAKNARRVKVVQRAGDELVGVGVEIFAELVALIAQVAFDLEFNFLRRVLVGPHACHCVYCAAPRGG